MRGLIFAVVKSTEDLVAKAERLGRMRGQQQRVKNLTTHQSTITKFATPLSETFASISRVTVQHFEAKAQKARLAHDIKTLSAFDPYMLKDIGMEGFKQLSPAHQERAIIDRIKHPSRI